MNNKSIIAHQVLFTFKAGIDWNSELAVEAEKVTKNHMAEIQCIQFWHCGRSVIDRDKSVDFSVLGIFKSKSDLCEYMIHQDHQKGVDLWKKISTWVVSDILLSPDEY